MSGTTIAWGYVLSGVVNRCGNKCDPPAKSWGIKVLISLQSDIAKEIANYCDIYVFFD